MKHLNTYIEENQIKHLNEGLLDKLKNWFKNLFKDQETLEKKTLDVDIKEIKGPEDSVELKDIISNQEEMNLINNSTVGFPITSTLIKQSKKYLVYEDEKGNKKEYEPQVDRYFYVEGENKYEIGLIIYDESIKNDNNYVNILNLEVIQQVNNISEVQKYINQIFEDKMKKTYQGSQYVSLHPRVKAVLIKQGYKSENMNKNILFKNFK